MQLGIMNPEGGSPGRQAESPQQGHAAWPDKPRIPTGPMGILHFTWIPQRAMGAAVDVAFMDAGSILPRKACTHLHALPYNPSLTFPKHIHSHGLTPSPTHTPAALHTQPHTLTHPYVDLHSSTLHVFALRHTHTTARIHTHTQGLRFIHN